MVLSIFDKYFVDSDCLEAAFEGLSAHTKGWIKKTLGVCRNYYRPDFPVSFHSQANKIENTLITTSKEPCDCCVILYPSEYASYTRAIAALTPGLFAGVENVVPLIIHSPLSQEYPEVKHSSDFKNLGQARYPDLAMDFNLLAAWELAGVEDIALLPEKDVSLVFKKLLKAAAEQKICLVVLGNPTWKHELEAFSTNPNIKIWQEKVPELIHVQANLKESVHILKNLHPDIKIKTAKNSVPSALFVVGDEDFRLEADQPLLCLDPEYAGCWVWPDLAMDFYHSHILDIGQ